MPPAQPYYRVEQPKYNRSLIVDTQADTIQYTKPELLLASEKYEVIEDCMAGQMAVKAKGDFYLPRPNPEDESDRNKKRYDSLLKRAIFTNFISPTVLGLKGQSFVYTPSKVVPDRLKPMLKNVNGCYGIDQLAENCMVQTLSLNRGGLYTDFPNITRELSVAEKEKIMPSIINYSAHQIINWDEISYDGQKIKKMVVLCENYNTGKGKFKPVIKKQYRLLGLDDNNEFYIEVYQESNNKEYKIIAPGRIYPMDGKGNHWNEIPFTFLSSNGDSADIVEPQMFDLAALNIGHYINSASYEDSCNTVGEPTVVIIGLTQQWKDKNFKDGIMMGSRGGIPLPVNADAKLLQVAPNTMVHEAMLHKESQIVALGGKYITPTNVVKTATESVMDNSEQNSILMSNSKNNSLAITKHLNYSLKYLTGDVDEKIEYKLLTENAMTNLTVQEQQQLINNFFGGIMTFKEIRKKLRDAGLAIEIVDSIKAPIKPESNSGGGRGKPSGTVNARNGGNLPGNKNNS